MTDEQINIAIAEACGWTGINPNCTDTCICFDPKGVMCEGIPDYCHDLNAMHEAEERLTGREIGDYHFWIIDNDDTNATHFVPGACPTSRNLWYLTHATARQRAEAFLRTLGKWKEAVNPTEITPHHRDDTSHSATRSDDREPASP